MHLLLLGHPAGLPASLSVAALWLGSAGPLSGLLDHLVREDELELCQRDKAARSLLDVVGLCVFVVIFLGGLLSRCRLLEKEDAGVDSFELIALNRRTVCTDNLHRVTHSEHPAGRA